MKDYADSLLIGTFVKTRGIHGELVLELNEKQLLNNIKESLFIEINGLMVPFFIEQTHRINSTRISVKLERIQNHEKALEYIDCNVFIPNKDVEYNEKEISPSLLIGFNVIDKNVGNIGTVKDFIDSKNNPLLVISYNSKEILLPFNNAFIDKLNQKKQEVKINAPEGLIDIYLQ